MSEGPTHHWRTAGCPRCGSTTSLPDEEEQQRVLIGQCFSCGAIALAVRGVNHVGQQRYQVLWAEPLNVTPKMEPVYQTGSTRLYGEEEL